MALDVDWAGTDTNPNRIFVPRADMAVVQASPEVRELDVNQFHLDLRTVEADVEGAAWPETHVHETQSILSGQAFARKVEILPPYQIEFEDGQYSVRAVGANHNILDVKVNNQVSLAVFLSSGLINSPELQTMAYEDQAVLVDPNHLLPTSQSGTTPLGTIGTRRRPVDNFTDALAIMAAVGLQRIKVIGGTDGSPIQLPAGDYTGVAFYGDCESATFIEVSAAAQVSDTKWYDMNLRGSFDGHAHIERCVVNDLDLFAGIVQRCRLRGTIALTGTEQFSMLSCLDDLAGTATPAIDFNNAGVEVIVRNFFGGLNLRNRANTTANVSIDGLLRIVLEPTFGGGGTVILRGVGPPATKLYSEPASFTLLDQLDGPEKNLELLSTIFDQSIASHRAPGTMGAAIAEAWSLRGFDVPVRHTTTKIDISNTNGASGPVLDIVEDVTGERLVTRRSGT